MIEKIKERLEKSSLSMYPDFCRKMSVKYPSIPVITRFDGFVILSDFHSVFSEIKVFKKIFLALAIFDVLITSL